MKIKTLKKAQKLTDDHINYDQITSEKEKKFYNYEQINHVAFIMDGNGRWGKKKIRIEIRAFSGVKTVKKIVEASIKSKIPIVHFMFSLQKIGKDLNQK